MRVELVSHLPKGSVSGIGRYVEELHRQLQEQIDVTITQGIDPPLAERFQILHNFPIGVKDHRPGSIVHYTQIMGCAQMLWNPVRPAVATVHDLGMLVWPQEAMMFNWIDRLFLRLAIMGLKQMDAIIAVSEATRGTVVDYLGVPSERVWTVHEGYDSSRFGPILDARRQIEQRYGLNAEEGIKYLLYVGTEIPRKNIPTLLKAIALLPRNVKLIKVGRAGGEKYRKNTERAIAELGLQESVLFFEDVPDQELALFYCAADAYCCASFVEGFGLPVLEALACGTPVACSSVGSLPEITGEAALLFPPDNLQAIVAALSLVLTNCALRERLIAEGLKQAQKFSWHQSTKDTRMVYETLLPHSSSQLHEAERLPSS